MRLSIPETLPVAYEEFSVVIANALENAINACRSLPKEQRRIVCKCICRPKLMLEISNPYRDDIVFSEEGLPLSCLLYTSSLAPQKNYKIRIKKGKGSWRQQRTIALNKHAYDPLRFRNKLAYDLMKGIPQMIGARTQFVHLYVKDETAGGSGQFEDYGLYTQVEQMNKNYLENHGLDDRGHLYKINFFEWYPYKDALKLKTDEGYDLSAFEQYLEVKGNDDHEKLLHMLEELNDYSIPIDKIVEQYFDVENICYWMAFQTLIGNYDIGSRNGYIYSPLNSDKWYLISWDNDASLARRYYEYNNVTEGMSWEQGLTIFTHSRLFQRMFK